MTIVPHLEQGAWLHPGSVIELSSLPMEQMPKTFIHAIEVARRLGICYLWIDSLCIVQDDNADKAREMKQIGVIFERSCCTIAAIDAIKDETNIDKGLFLPRENDPLAVCFKCPFSIELLDGLISKNPKLKGHPYIWKYRWLSPPSLNECSSVASRNEIILRPRSKGY
jgi:hypothetical protein